MNLKIRQWKNISLIKLCFQHGILLANVNKYEGNCGFFSYLLKESLIRNFNVFVMLPKENINFGPKRSLLEYRYLKIENSYPARILFKVDKWNSN